MGVVLRACAVIALLWAAALVWAREYVGAPAQWSPLAISLAHSWAAANAGFALAFWRAAGEAVPNRPVIYAALLVYGLRIVAVLYEMLAMQAGMVGLLNVADLVVTVSLSVALIEALPGALRQTQQGEGNDPLAPLS